MPALVVRPIGFRPAEISALTNRRVIEEHASEAAFLWGQREEAADASHFKLKHLALLDERVTAHLKGLILADDVGWGAVQRHLADGEPGGVFVASYVAFASSDPARAESILPLAGIGPAFRDAVIAALGWLTPLDRDRALATLRTAPAVERRLIALAAMAAQRQELSREITYATHHSNAVLRATALRAIGEIKQRDQVTSAERGLRDLDPTCRFWAAWSLALLDNSHNAQVAFEAGCDEPALARAAVEIAMRCGEPSWARETIRMLATAPTSRRLSIVAAGAFGDPATIPWLLDHLENPEFACVAGEAFSMITGADLDYLSLKRDAPEDAVQDPEDADLPWPDSEGVRAWWSNEQKELLAGQRYLCGRPVGMNSAMQVLRDGYQRQRHSAAIELARSSDAYLFPVRERADIQKRRLAA